MNEEVLSFKRLGRENRILPLIVSGEPNASDEQRGLPASDECFVPALRFALGEDAALSDRRIELTAADARVGQDGRVNAKLKLLAGILGVSFDELRQRERIRMRRRMFTLAAVALAVAGAFAEVWQFQTARRKATEVEASKQRAALIERQTADEAEERGRQSLLAGDASAAATYLAKALAAAPDRLAVRLMLGVAQRRVGGLVATLQHADDEVANLVIDRSGARLLVIGRDRAVATLWELPSGRLLRRIVPASGNPDELHGAVFHERGDKLLLEWSQMAVVQDVSSGAEISLTPGLGASFSFLGDGTRILSVEDGRDEKAAEFVVRNTSDGREVRRFDLGPGKEGGIQTDRNGRTALAGWWQPAPPPEGVKLWAGEPRLKWFEVESGKVIADLARHEYGKLELSPEGTRLLYLRSDGAFEVRSETGVLWSTSPTKDLAPEARWSPGGRCVVVTTNGTSVVYEASTGNVLWSGYLGSPTIDDGDSMLAYSDDQGVVHVHELLTGKLLAAFTDRIGWSDLASFPKDRFIRFARDARYLVLAGSGHFVKLWDWRRATSDPRVVGNRKAHSPTSAAFSADGSLLAVRNEDASVAVWETATNRLRCVIAKEVENGGAWTFAFSPDGSVLLIGAQEPPELFAATVWNTIDGNRIERLDDGATAVNGRIETRTPMLEQHIRVAWGTSRFITANFAFGRLYFWNPATRARVAELGIGPGFMELSGGGVGPDRLALARDRSRGIVAGGDGVARVFSVEDARLISELRHPTPKLAGCELNSDGARALTFDAACHGAVWDVATAMKVAEPELTGIVTNEIRLSADGNLVAAACADQRVRVWDVTTRKLRHTLSEQKPPGEGTDTLGAPIDLTAADARRGFLDVRFDPNGFWLAGVNEDGRLCIWESSSGRQILRWKLDPASRNARLIASNDGQQLGVFGLDGAIRIFDLAPSAPSKSANLR